MICEMLLIVIELLQHAWVDFFVWNVKAKLICAQYLQLISSMSRVKQTLSYELSSAKFY